MSYFPLVTDKVFRHFQRASNQDDIDEMWLEFEGQSLKWHYPIGVLFDMYGCQSALPWNVTVHFRRFPEQELLRCPNREAVESNFMSSVKEADSLKHRSTVMNSMRKNEHKQLWTGLSNDRFDQFWNMNKRLMERVNGEPFRYVPLRIMMAERPYEQKLFKTVSDDGELLTFGDFLKQNCSHILNMSDGDQISVLPNWSVFIQGVQPPLETPMQWLSEHMSHPDNFLYVILNQSY